MADCTGDGPAAAAGVRPGDRILTVDGAELESFVELRDYVMERPGETIVLGIERRGGDTGGVGGAGSAGGDVEGDAAGDGAGSTHLDIPVQLDEVVRLDSDGSRCVCSRASVCGSRQAYEGSPSAEGPVGG